MARRRSASLDPETSSSNATDETPLLARDSPETPPPSQRVVSWASIPEKGQLAVILKWFDPSLDASEIAKQAGYITAVFAATQGCTSMWWGRAADHPRLGRKRVLVLGLMGSAVSALGMGFSTSFRMALCFRFLAGALNGNVGVLRTMVSEIVVDKRYRPRAFLLLPMCFNIGVIIGPLISGFLADPLHSMSSKEGYHSLSKVISGLQWLVDFPYELPNLFFATVLGSAAVMNWQDKSWVNSSDYAVLPSSDIEISTVEETQHPESPREETVESGFRAILTQIVILIMLQLFLQSLHISAFNSIFFTLLPTPRSDNASYIPPFRFTGGLGLSSQKVGLANTTIGMVGIPLQLLVYPRLIGLLGAQKSYLIFLPLSIVAFCLTPYLVLLPDNIGIIWTCLSGVLVLQVLSRTFVNPATILLVNDSAPNPKLLGRLLST
ncbi:major facilitator superfamily domain-containing protein [Aspergillus heterothallicus]